MPDQNKVACFAHEWIEREINENQAQSIFIPAGKTPIGLYQHWERNRPAYLERVKLLQIDEVITGPQKGVFKTFFRQYLPTYFKNIQWIGEQENVADLAILGLGKNGHIAFHEPGLPHDFTMGCVKLDQTTCKNLKAGKNAWGHTYGLGALMKCKKILMIVLGENKNKILERLLSRDPLVPAVQLLEHPGFEIVCDKSAYDLTKDDSFHKE